MNDDFFDIFVYPNDQDVNNFIFFDRDNLVLQTIAESEDWKLGTHQLTVEMDDFEGNKSVDSILLVVSCPTGNTHPLCFTPEEEEEASIAVIETPDPSLNTVTSLSELETVNNINQILDYEVETTIAIED